MNNDEIVPAIDRKAEYTITLDVVESFCYGIFHRIFDWRTSY